MAEKQPQPVLNATSIASAVQVLAVIAGGFGIVVSEDDQAVIVAAILAVVAAVGVIAHLIAAFHARSKVTPLASPQTVDAAGEVTPLVPLQVLDVPDVPADLPEPDEDVDTSDVDTDPAQTFTGK